MAQKMGSSFSNLVGYAALGPPPKCRVGLPGSDAFRVAELKNHHQSL